MGDIVLIVSIVCIFIAIMYTIYTRYKISKDAISMGYSEILVFGEDGHEYKLWKAPEK